MDSLFIVTGRVPTARRAVYLAGVGAQVASPQSPNPTSRTRTPKQLFSVVLIAQNRRSTESRLPEFPQKCLECGPRLFPPAVFPLPCRAIVFLRCTKRRKDGQEYRYWSVVENQRCGHARSVQRHALYLGELNGRQEASWRRTVELFGQNDDAPQQVTLFPEDHAPVENAGDVSLPIVRVRLNQMALRMPRQNPRPQTRIFRSPHAAVDDALCRLRARREPGPHPKKNAPCAAAGSAPTSTPSTPSPKANAPSSATPCTRKSAPPKRTQAATPGS